MKQYFKWLFTRWYLYALGIFWFVYSYKPQGELFLWEIVLGRLIGNIIAMALMISLIVGIKKIYLKIKSK